MNCLLQSFKTFVKRYQHLVEKYFVTCVQMVLIQGRPLFPNNVLRYYLTFLRMVKFIFYRNSIKHDIFVYLNLVLCSGYRFCIFLLFLRWILVFWYLFFLLLHMGSSSHSTILQAFTFSKDINKLIWKKLICQCKRRTENKKNVSKYFWSCS
jgi:hypothetical protein